MDKWVYGVIDFLWYRPFNKMQIPCKPPFTGGHTNRLSLVQWTVTFLRDGLVLVHAHPEMFKIMGFFLHFQQNLHPNEDVLEQCGESEVKTTYFWKPVYLKRYSQTFTLRTSLIPVYDFLLWLVIRSFIYLFCFNAFSSRHVLKVIWVFLNICYQVCIPF